MTEARSRIERGERILVTTLTKRTAEDLTDYLRDAGLRVQYIHSEVDAIERVEILRSLRAGEFDILVGINLLREGLDLPEVSLVAILDADKEGFLRSETSLIQTAGRAARHVNGQVFLFADHETQSIKTLLEVTEYRRKKQIAHNQKHGIQPQSVKRGVQESLHVIVSSDRPDKAIAAKAHQDMDVMDTIRELEQSMVAASENLDFEQAALYRDQIEELKMSAGMDSISNSSKKAGRKKTVSYRKKKN